MRLLVATLLVVGVFAVPADASERVEFTSPGWVLLDIEHTSSEWQTDVRLFYAYAGQAVGASITYRDGAVEAQNWLYAADHGVRFEASHDGRTLKHAVRPAEPWSWFTGAATTEPGHYRALFATWGDVTSWYYEPLPGVNVSLVAQGPTYTARLREMEPAASASAVAYGPTVQASTPGRFAFEVEHTLVGAFFDYTQLTFLRPGATPGTLTGPEGSVSCPCRIVELEEEHGAMGPGTYEASWAGASATIRQAPWVAWADIPST